MRRRYFLVTTGTFLALVGALTGVLLLLVRYEPRWYKQAAVADAAKKDQESREFLNEFGDMLSNIVNNERDWQHTFTDAQINSFLDVGFKEKGLAGRLLPEEISDPRVVIEPDRMHLAFRYRWGALHTIVSLDFNVWLAPGEPNVIALEMAGFHVGALPISVQSMLEDISKVIRDNGIEINWYRQPDTGKPVAVLRFQKDERTTMQLQAVHLTQGAITLSGRTADGSSRSPEEILTSLFAFRRDH
jgi:hypothetical protein